MDDVASNSPAQSADILLPCRECDLVVAVPEPEPGQWLRCPRCAHPLARYTPHDQTSPALAVTALIMLALALAFPYIRFEKSGVSDSMGLLDAATQLAAFHDPLLGIIVFTTIVVLPGCFLVALLWVHLSLSGRHRLPGTALLVRSLPRWQPWMMADVFAIAALISLIKIAGMAQIGLEPGFWAFSGFALALLFTVQRFHPLALWARLAGPPAPPEGARAGETAAGQGLVGCEQCGHLQARQAGRACQRCGARLHRRHPHSLQRTTALLVAAILCCFPAHLLPIMVTTSLGNTQPSTIISGVLQFIGHGDWPIALVIFVASVLIPFGKIMALGWLCLASRQNRQLDMAAQMRLYRITEWVGRWSMIDVFVVAIVVALVRLGNLLSIQPGPGGLAFAGVVVLTMLAAMSFDPRLIWDQQQRRNHDPTLFPRSH
ncbi:paraquat-inducible protein A [Alloalcanivorax mobilis]|uniref:paraquat-inducible protein A n=1 Tax=Alloalcanivorax mobilis TaxID=2019569 RepID=UPI000B5B36EC|nr:paraquat-inducible protein A [Alloalcanivorax mobilis]ASK35514.1 paraquat-inducible membrane protein A [Alcanivorax sp. N3-2A]|tara:strand:+ start:23579 stop:24874 length:1296 start_codon:yes stop_codon:yes gene_type:complete